MSYKLSVFPKETLPTDYATAEECERMKNKIESVLTEWGIGFIDIKATPGPFITFFEVYPKSDVKLSKVKNITDDLRLSLGGRGCRVICPIPGKETFGIELPNNTQQSINFNAVAGTDEFTNAEMDLPLALGVTTDGKPLIVDLAKSKHILIGGAVGQGKSIVEHTIISSLLCKKTPEDLRLVLIDPKMVEFIAYESLTNYLATPDSIEEPIVRNVQDAVLTLENLCEVMDKRYEVLKAAGVHNIKEYNQMVANGKLDPASHQHMPYIVTIIDEYGDFMLTAGKTFEKPLCKLAQLSSTVGIHLVISTQRNASSVVSANIKAYFPSRICCRTTSAHDSRIILNQTGAECLMGKGDLLYLESDKLIRLQGAFIADTTDISNLCNQILA